MEKIKVFLSDSQVLFREGIHFILSGEEDFEVIGETTNNEEAFSLIEANPPNVAILSILNGNITGPEVARRIKRSFPSVSVVLTMDKSSEEQLFAAMKSGVSACLTKGTDPETLLNTVRKVAEGNHPIMEFLLVPELASRAILEFEELSTINDQIHNLLAKLATKETEILNSIAANNNIEQVAAKLNINEETIRRHLEVILSKLVANDQARALIEAAQSSLILHSIVKKGEPSAEYVTKKEFNEFKETLMARLKSFIGELA